MERALNPPEGKSLSEASAFAMDHFADAGNDRTARAILAPLEGAGRDSVMRARRLVKKGVDAYYKGQPIESLQLHDQAAVAMGNDAPDFDRLWMKLKRADALLRNARPPDGVQNAAAARRLMDEVVSESRTLGFDWLLGQALVSKTAASANMQDFNYTLPILHEALAKLSSVGTPEDLVRPLNYLAMVYSIAGDAEKSLDTTYQALRLTAPDDNVRLAQLYWIAGLQLSRMGYTRYSKTLEQKAVRYAYASDNPGVIAGIVPALGSRHAREGDYETAENILHEIGMLRRRVRAAGEEELFSLSFNLLCSQVMKGKGDPDHAENCLKENLRVLDKQTIAPPGFFAETLLQLGGIQWANSDFDRARETFRRAIEVIEVNDAYLATSVLRMPFESQRRDIYDMAIGFEYDQNSKEAAWDYAQRYRSKLFLEFLRQKNPNVLDRAINRADAQQLIPENLQVLEYVVLKDRLLIWLVSRDKFFSVSVSVTRGDIEAKVSSFLADINRKKDIEKQSSELYRLLIEPVEAELDPKKTLAIVPDLALHRLNFPALYSAATEKFLIQQHAILESPNLTTLLSGQNGPRTHGKVVAFGARQDSVGAAEELHALKRIYGDIDTFNGPAALKPAFLLSLTGASTLHYVGHSQDAADPLRSSILLDGDREGPNSVTAADISNQKMPANSVVVLASCDSSVGNSRDGIGMRGLTSAFLISGAGSVVGSLWLVESESTSQLVLRFHKDFAAGTPAIVALRNAQLALIEKGDHPYYWSGFVVTGNTSAL
ncbi:MAG TPA: CHAT domain-containing protein, partial [Pyrinomonadaceae bacterium]|nr:CHAT domain-containing protein [Pyrinomonadaceae bacterium]